MRSDQEILEKIQYNFPQYEFTQAGAGRYKAYVDPENPDHGEIELSAPQTVYCDLSVSNDEIADILCGVVDTMGSMYNEFFPECEP